MTKKPDHIIEMGTGKREHQIKAKCPLCNRVKWCSQYCGGVVGYMCANCSKVLGNYDIYDKQRRTHHLQIHHLKIPTNFDDEPDLSYYLKCLKEHLEDIKSKTYWIESCLHNISQEIEKKKEMEK